MVGKNGIVVSLSLALVLSGMLVCKAQGPPAGAEGGPPGAVGRPGPGFRKGAESRPGVRGGIRSILSELNLSSAQEEQARQILADMRLEIRRQGNTRPEMQRIMREIRELRGSGASEEAIAAKHKGMADLMAPMNEARQRGFERIRGILTDEQKEKFSALLAKSFQHDAVRHIETDLGLSPEQQEKLKELQKTMSAELAKLADQQVQVRALRNEISRLASTGPGNEDLIAAKREELSQLQQPFREVRKSFLDEVGKILTPEQQKRYFKALKQRRRRGDRLRVGRAGERRQTPTGSSYLAAGGIDYDAIFEKLDLSEDQENRIAGIKEAMKEDFARRNEAIAVLRSRARPRVVGPDTAPGPGAPGSPEDTQARMREQIEKAYRIIAEVNRDFQREVTEVLTPEQARRMFEHMQKSRSGMRRDGPGGVPGEEGQGAGE